LDLGYKRVPATAGEYGQDVAHARLAFDGAERLEIKEAGYMYIYLSNENETPVEVFFDDFEVVHTKSPVVQSEEYYPFGLTFNSFTRENSVPSQNKYNGKEEQCELELRWLDYGARMYNSEIARWNGIDQMSDTYASFSNYAYVLGNPVANTDVNGKWTVSRHRSMTLQALTVVGIGGEQAQLIAHYASVFADNPGQHGQLNNMAHPTDQITYRDDIKYGKTANSQVTDYTGTGENYNIWHSMRSPWEMLMEGKPGGITAEKAMLRGLEFGWNQIFRSAEKGKLTTMEKNSDAIEQFGQGLHALQDAGAHKGRHDVGFDHLRNDRFGDTSESSEITRSAIMVHAIMSGDVEGFNKMYEHGNKAVDLTGASGKDILNLDDKLSFQGKNLRYNWETKKYDIK
jgi:RHS repeat-associated protein